MLIRESKKRILILIIAALLILQALMSENCVAQTYDINNAAEKSHPWISDINPAMVSFQYGQVSLGFRSFHLGFLQDKALGLNESHISASFPFHLPLEIGIGCDLRYFSAGIYSELQSSLLFSRKIVSQFGIGLKVGLIRFGFSRDNFSTIHENDPLLSGNLGVNGLNIGAGAYWNPGNWSVGVALNHLNQPNMGYQTSAHLLRDISAAVGYRFGYITPTVLIQNDGLNVRYGLAISAKRERWGTIRFSYENTMPFKMEIQFSLSQNNKLQYGLDVPRQHMSSVSMGSHEAIYTHIFDRGPDIGQPEILLSTNEIQIFEENIVRSMPSDMYPSELERLTELAPDYLKTAGSFRNLLIIPTGNLSQYESEKIRQERYLRLGQEIQKKLSQHPGLQLILQTEETSLKDARAFKHFLQKHRIAVSDDIGIAALTSTGELNLSGFYPGKENETRQKPKCSQDHLSITMMVPGKIRHVKEWTLDIKNSRDKVIRSFQGRDKLLENIVWDWKNNWGELVPAGKYFCHLSLKTMSDQVKTSSSKEISVTKINRKIVLQFKRQRNLQVNKLVP